MPSTIRPLAFAAAIALAGSPVLTRRQAPPRPPAGTGVVAGRVIDADSSAPIAGASVHVGVLAGGSQDVTTDAQGRFEASHVGVGSLSIVTTVNAQQVRYQTPSPSLQNEFAPGEQLDNITLRVPHAATISGSVRNPDGSPAANVTVMAHPRRITTGRRSFGDGTAGGTDANGAFALKVPPGRYVVGVPVVTTTMPNAVAAAYRDALAAVVAAGSRPSGPIPIALHASPLASLPTTPPGSVGYQPTGEFSVLIGFPGRYVLNWLSPESNWMMQSVAMAGSDITDRPFDLTDRDIEGLVVTIATGGASLSGVIRGQIDTVNVLLFPAEYQAWVDHGKPFRSARGVVASKAGAFAMSKLPAGNYLVAAFSDADTVNWPDTAFVQAAAQVATHVTLAADEHKNIDLNVVKMPH